MPPTLSIVITAYRSERFIEECLTSVYGSMGQFAEPWELLVGVDGCPETRHAIEACSLGPNTAAYYFPVNVGTYVATNTLMARAGCRRIVRFDSDDIMLPAFGRYLSDANAPLAILRFPYRSFTESPGGERRIEEKDRFSYTCGIVCLGPGVLDALGGYRPWRCAADADLLHRAALAEVTVEMPPPAYGPALLRRRHADSLTDGTTTGIRSEIRNRCWELTRQATSPFVAPVTAPVERLA